ncbi:MAG: undecaprenyldiphospho-muramoylpentapeptide beta-N-acetylglucosaminyltransferase [Saprospiraceae bacterium]|nr:undecaprenyldiphospho-muramoylpentapeptide beta-N-acetylglucosaminyltransferase [Saprospiraceae bacterium]
MKFIISGGGTGGHIYPAIAIAEALKRKLPNAEFLFVGAQGRMEMEKIPKAGYKIEGLWISGFQRKQFWKNFSLPFKIIASFFKARKIIKRFKPDLAIGVGGYASAMAVRAAAGMGIPTLIHEQNSYAGKTNKMLSGFAKKICVAYDGMDRFFPKEKIIHTGNPIRQDILELNDKRTEAFKHYGLDPNLPTLLVIGGSLGARTLNESIAKNLAAFEQAGVQVFWQAGKFYIEEYKKFATLHKNIKITAFIDRMDLAYALADVVISRAGALSISELCLCGKPSILVPSPNVAEDHQTANAMALVNKQAALLVKDVEAHEKLCPSALGLLQSESEQKMLSRSIKQLGIADAADRIAEEVLQLVR